MTERQDIMAENKAEQQAAVQKVDLRHLEEAMAELGLGCCGKPAGHVCCGKHHHGAGTENRQEK